jgi:hypothetical protein
MALSPDQLSEVVRRLPANVNVTATTMWCLGFDATVAVPLFKMLFKQPK